MNAIARAVLVAGGTLLATSVSLSAFAQAQSDALPGPHRLILYLHASSGASPNAPVVLPLGVFESRSACDQAGVAASKTTKFEPSEILAGALSALQSVDSCLRPPDGQRRLQALDCRAPSAVLASASSIRDLCAKPATPRAAPIRQAPSSAPAVVATATVVLNPQLINPLTCCLGESASDLTPSCWRRILLGPRCAGRPISGP